MGNIYQALGQCHEGIMNRENIAQKKIGAVNLKCMLNLFCIELDKIIAGTN